MLNRYALLTQIDTNTYEVFDIFIPADGSPSALRISEALLDNKVKSSKDTSGMNNVALNSIWNGAEFVLPESMAEDWPKQEQYANGFPSFIDDMEMATFSLMSDDRIFFMNILPTNSIFYDKYKAAFSNNVIMLQTPEDIYISPGYVWDGTNWIEP